MKEAQFIIVFFFFASGIAYR